MKKYLLVLLVIASGYMMGADGCDGGRPANTSAKDEQAHTEDNQRALNQTQPPPTITWSLERDNLIKRFKLQNDRSVSFYMYVFIEGIGAPIGYYQVNKVSSVNSQLTNPMQIITGGMGSGYYAEPIPSPAEDGSYGTNGEGVFGFTPEDIYIETNMKYITSTVPLHFNSPVNRLAIIDTEEAKKILESTKKAMGSK